MRELFEKYILLSREDMRGYIRDDAESLTEQEQDELARLVMRYESEGCEDPLSFALSEIYQKIGSRPQYDEEDCDALEE